MMIEPNREHELLLGRDLYISRMKHAEAPAAEQSLSVQPGDMPLRARLLLYYTWRNETVVPIEILEARLRHMFWFVENVPDWKFCGERFFYLGPGEPGYERLKNLWLTKIEESPNLMRRVNAYLLFAQYGDSNLQNYFREFFGRHGDNPWVRALREINSGEATWFHETISTERAKPIATAEVIDELTEQADNKKWGPVTVNHSDNATSADFEQARVIFESKPDLNNLALLAGYSWRRYALHSPIEFDPAVVLFRVALASWVLRNVPGSRLAKSSLYMAPFLSAIFHGKLLAEPTDFLTDLLIVQIQRNPDDLRIAKNAAFFRTRVDVTWPAIGKRISEELRKTAIGKRALKSCSR